MRKIKLPQNQYAIVDDSDFEWLSQWSWSIGRNGYAVRDRGRVYMHRLINQTPKGRDTDHINHNKLDNRRCNLRTATRGLNVLNTPMRSDNKTGIRGVCWDSSKKRFLVQLKIGKKRYSRSFRKIEEAIKLRHELEAEHGISRY